MSDELGLLHVSEGDGKERYIVVSKPTTVAQPKPDTVQVELEQQTNNVLHQSSPTTNADVVKPPHKLDVTNEDTISTKVSTIAGVWKCTVCGFVIPEINKELHQLRCEREQRQLHTIMKEITKPVVNQHSKKKPQQVRNSKKPKSTTTVALKGHEDDDLDGLLAEIKEKDAICNFTGCKKSSNHLGIKCPFCHRKFCMTHNMAEVHGCGETAKKHAKQQLEKELRGKGQKKLDPTRRAHLQRKLDKKIDDLSSERQKKKQPSS